MLLKSRRLSRIDFLTAQKHGRSYSFPHFSLVVHQQPATNNQLPRFSVVTSAKLHKRAVVRNRLRRTIYNELSTASRELSADIIIFPRPSMLNLSREEIGHALNQALSKLTSH